MMKNLSDSKSFKNKIPYGFILDHLTEIDIVIKPMFGCYGIYANGRLCLFLMNREKPLIRRKDLLMQKGVYIATTAEYTEKLKQIFPNAEFEFLKAGKVWIFVSEKYDYFEEYVTKACEMMTCGDVQIGR